MRAPSGVSFRLMNSSFFKIKDSLLGHETAYLFMDVVQNASSELFLPELNETLKGGYTPVSTVA